MAKHSATFIPIICSLFYLGQWTSRRQPPGAWWKTRSGHRWFILYFYVPDNAFSVVWIAASSGFEMTLHHTCNNCTISTLSDRRDFFPNRTKKHSQFVCTSATLTTTRFPFFGAFIVHPAIGKAARWIRSEILNIFLFLLHWLDFWELRKVYFCKHYFRRMMAIITAVAPLSFK